jgi:hypothetical protein
LLFTVWIAVAPEFLLCGYATSLLNLRKTIWIPRLTALAIRQTAQVG